MRFKNLRIIVGIAMVVFILVVGNIIAFGAFHGKNEAANKSSELVLLAPIIINKSSENISKSSNTQTSQNTQTPTTTKTVVHKTTKTSAS